jgi:predicted PurR-regulated permease PerM
LRPLERVGGTEVEPATGHAVTDVPPVQQAPRRDPWAVVPFGAKVAAAWAAVIALVGIVVMGVVLLLAQVLVVVWALVAALLLSAILQPLSAHLRAAGVPRMLAAAVVFVGFLAVLLGVLWLIGQQVAGQFSELGDQLSEGLRRVRDWLNDAFGISRRELDRLADRISGALQGSSGGLASGLTSAAGTVANVVTGTVLALFVTFFVLADGRRLWAWVVSVFPRASRDEVGSAGERAWRALVSYMRSIVVVALADATLIGLALVVLGVPLVLPLAMLTFLGAFIPIVGATLAGAVAVLIALVDQGAGTALVLLGIVLLVQWLDSDLLQPLIVSRAVSLHPVAVALAVTTGSLIAGIGGTVAATPLLAAAHAMIRGKGDDP